MGQIDREHAQNLDEIRLAYKSHADVQWLLAQLDAALARAEAADKRITEIRDGIGAYRYWRTNDDVMMYSCRFCPSSREAVGAEGPHPHHRICVLNLDREAGLQEARAALAVGEGEG